MTSSEFLPSLNLVTLVVVLLAAAVALLLFLRKRSNRHSMDGHRERNIAADIDAGKGAPDHLSHK